MKITADGKIIEALAIHQSTAIIQGEERPTLAIAFPGTVTEDEIKALSSGVINIDEGYKVYMGYTGFVDVEVLLYRPSDAELSFERASELEQRMIDLEKKLQDAIKERDDALEESNRLSSELTEQRMAMTDMERGEKFNEN